MRRLVWGVPIVPTGTRRWLVGEPTVGGREDAVVYPFRIARTASEHGARMAAMDAATNNAEDMINSLTLHLNRVRQASITKEIIEVISGASA